MPTAASYTDAETGRVWARAYAQDFPTIVGPGSLWASDGGGNLPAANPYSYATAGPGVGFNVYQAGISTTSKVGEYHPQKTTQVKQVEPGKNALCIRMHVGVGSDGVTKPLSGTFVPRIPGYFTTHQDATFRYRVINRVNNGAVFGVVWQSIAEAQNWPEYGEHDFPENSVPNPIQGNFHPSSILRLPNTPLPHGRDQDTHITYTTAQPRYLTDWVTCRTKWEPTSTAGVSRLRWWVAGATGWELIMDRTQWVYNQPMVFMMQCGDETYTAPDGTSYVVAPTTEAEVQVDWCSVYLPQAA